jgi:hypothetical protein
LIDLARRNPSERISLLVQAYRRSLRPRSNDTAATGITNNICVSEILSSAKNQPDRGQFDYPL